MNFCHCGHELHEGQCTKTISETKRFYSCPDFIGDEEYHIKTEILHHQCNCIRRNGRIPYQQECNLEGCHCKKNKEALLF